MDIRFAKPFQIFALSRHLAIQRVAVVGVITLTLEAVFCSYVAAQDSHLGIIEYEISCLPCHGIDGRGDGPHANSLKTTPADLTLIKRRHNGTFPRKLLTEIIDGRAVVASHGQREMPIWGERYRASDVPNASAEWIDRRVRAQIDALVSYLETLQED